MKQYIIDEETLLKLLEDSARLACLDQDEVDNWEWQLDTLVEFIAEMLSVDEDEVREQGLSFDDVAKSQLQLYKEYKSPFVPYDDKGYSLQF